jgi:hypothetical protein
MSENTPKPDILYSVAREKPRETFIFPEKFDQNLYSYEDVFKSDLLIAQQPYELNKYSPTPLEPFHLKLHNTDYYVSASAYMEGRLTTMASEVDLSPKAQQAITSEVEYEHLARSLKNNDAMRRIRESMKDVPYVDAQIAQLVLRARAARAEVRELAYLLSIFPEAEAIEVLKYTDPLNDKELAFAHAQFIYNLRMAAENTHGMVIDDSAAERPRPRVSHESVLPKNFITKGKEMDVYINNTHLELIGCYSHYVPDPDETALLKKRPTMAVINGQTIPMYGTAISKYLRVAKTSASCKDMIVETDNSVTIEG